MDFRPKDHFLKVLILLLVFLSVNQQNYITTEFLPVVKMLKEMKQFFYLFSFTYFYKKIF